MTGRGRFLVFSGRDGGERRGEGECGKGGEEMGDIPIAIFPRGGNGNVSLAQMAGMVCVRNVWGLIGGSSKGEPGYSGEWRRMGCVRRREGELMFMVGGERGELGGRLWVGELGGEGGGGIGVENWEGSSCVKVYGLE